MWSVGQLVLKCGENALPVTGFKYELVLRLIHYQCGTAPDDVATPALIAPSVAVPPVLQPLEALQ